MMVDMAGLWCDLAPETRCSTKPTEQPRFILVPKVVNHSNSQALIEKAFPFAHFGFWFHLNRLAQSITGEIFFHGEHVEDCPVAHMRGQTSGPRAAGKGRHTEQTVLALILTATFEPK